MSTGARFGVDIDNYFTIMGPAMRGGGGGKAFLSDFSGRMKHLRKK